MKKKIAFASGIILFLVVGGTYAYLNRSKPPVESKFVQNVKEFEPEVVEVSESNKTVVTISEVSIKKPGSYALIENQNHSYQTFNNCGPATLSMILNFHGVSVTQAELGSKMRPYQNQKGDNDDKTIFTHEFVEWAEEYNLKAINRVNGDIDLIKKFTSNGIPVVVKTWLNPGEDIGHFRLVLGYDDEKQVIIQDDSYHGTDKKIAYYDFLSMWQAFNYNYMIVYTADMEPTVKEIVGSEIDERTAWKNALARAEKENKLDPDNIYPIFNMSASAYQTDDLERSVMEFEKVENRLPRRMLWYQIEPILAYKELGNYDRTFEIIDNILENGNMAFSELHMIKGEIFLEKDEKENAREQFELAINYNENFEEARIMLAKL